LEKSANQEDSAGWPQRVLEVSASDLKNAWHAYLERVSEAGEEVVVTRYGKPVAKLVPYLDPGEGGGVFGHLEGTLTMHGDLTAPTGEEWDADA